MAITINHQTNDISATSGSLTIDGAAAGGGGGAWATYRQALRDITEQTGFPYSMIWPTKP